MRVHVFSNSVFKLSCKPTTLSAITNNKSRQFVRYSSTLSTNEQQQQQQRQTTRELHVPKFQLPFNISPKIQVAPVMDDPNLEYPPPYKRPPPSKVFKFIGFLQQIAENRVEDIETSLKKNENIINKYGPFYHLPLLTAVQYGNYEATKLLLRYRAEVNKQQLVTENTALHYVITAVAHKRVTQLKIAKVLLEHSASPNSVNSVGLTPIHLAVLRGNFDLLKLFVENSRVRVNFETKDPLGRKASEIAIFKERIDISDYLKQKHQEQT